MIMNNHDDGGENSASRYECMDFGACVDVSDEEDPRAICECQAREDSKRSQPLGREKLKHFILHFWVF